MAGPQPSQDLRLELDLDKYGLAFLKNQPVETWQAADVARLLDAFARENIAPVFYGLPFTPAYVQALLSLSTCRRCGRCCLPNPTSPDHPGISVSDADLRHIAGNSALTYKQLKKRSQLSGDPRFVRGRFLPLPCIFYDSKEKVCQVYDSRPLVCRTFPITDIPGKSGIAVNVGCDYGRDIYKGIIDHLKKSIR